MLNNIVGAVITAVSTVLSLTLYFSFAAAPFVFAVGILRLLGWL